VRNGHVLRRQFAGAGPERGRRNGWRGRGCCPAIQQMSLLHGKDLDECIGRVTGSSAGYFHDEDEVEREEVRHG